MITFCLQGPVWDLTILCMLIMIISLQVPLLLSIGEEDTALMKATESGDTDLVYLVLFHIWQKVLL